MEENRAAEPSMVEGTWQRMRRNVMGIPESTDVMILQRRGTEEALCKLRTGGAAWINVKDLIAPRIERAREAEVTIRRELAIVRRRMHQ